MAYRDNYRACRAAQEPGGNKSTVMPAKVLRVTLAARAIVLNVASNDLLAE
jgi:hypothetical protein